MNKKKRKKKKQEQRLLKYATRRTYASIKLTDVASAKKYADILSDSMKTTLADVQMTRLEGLSTKEAIVIDGDPAAPTENMVFYLNPEGVLHRARRDRDVNNDEGRVYTIVFQLPKKKVKDLPDNKTFKHLMKFSSLGIIYDKYIKKGWESMNKEDHTVFTNILFIPKLLMFKDSFGHMLEKPYAFNLCFVALPALKDANAGVEQLTRDAYIHRIITDTIETNIKLGNHYIICDPFNFPYMSRESNVELAFTAWKEETASKRCAENIRQVMYAIEDENLFIMFSNMSAKGVSYF